MADGGRIGVGALLVLGAITLMPVGGKSNRTLQLVRGTVEETRRAGRIHTYHH